jgi:hypothetical protein
MRKVALTCAVVSLVTLGASTTRAQNKPGTLPPVSLIVTVNACDDSKATEICGDGFSTEAGNTIYTSGIDGVEAKIDQYGNLIINFQTTRAAIRRLVYKYGAAVPMPPGVGSDHYMATLGANLHTMPDGTSVSVRSCPVYNDEAAQQQYLHSFDRDCSAGRLGSALLVTRMDATTWEVEPDPSTGAMAYVFSRSIKGRSPLVPYGNISLPFKMELRAK